MGTCLFKDLMFPCKFPKHEIGYWSLFNTFQWPNIAEKSYYKKQCCTCPLIPGNRLDGMMGNCWLKNFNTIKLLLLDRKLHSKTTCFKRGKTGETADLALPGILEEKKNLKQTVGFCWFLNFFFLKSFYVLSNSECNLIEQWYRVILFNTRGRIPCASLLVRKGKKGNWELQLSFELAVSTKAVILPSVGTYTTFFHSFGQCLIICFFFKSLKCLLIKLI